MSNINWTTWTMDNGIPFPTYGYYGGQNYFDGHVDDGTPPEFLKTPVDPLDYIFMNHDMLYTQASYYLDGVSLQDGVGSVRRTLCRLTYRWRTLSLELG